MNSSADSRGERGIEASTTATSTPSSPAAAASGAAASAGSAACRAGRTRADAARTRRRRPARRACRPLLRRLQERLVAAMHAIEVADGQRGAARGWRDVVDAVDDLHGRGIAIARGRGQAVRAQSQAGEASVRRPSSPPAATAPSARPRPPAPACRSTEHMLSKRARRLAG